MKLCVLALLVFAAAKAAEMKKLPGVINKIPTKVINEDPKVNSEPVFDGPGTQHADAGFAAWPLPEDGRIVSGGNTASQGQFPWHAVILLEGVAYCGGSLISGLHVLTAAHCAQGITSFIIRLGVTNLQTSQNGVVLLHTTSKIVHSGYNTNTLNNDIALLRLPSTVASTTYVHPIRLLRSSQTINSFLGATVIACGFSTYSSSGMQSTMKYSSLTVISSTVCAEIYGTSITTSTICASSSSTNPCVGDSGGGLVLKEEDGIYTQIGLANFLSSKCQAQYPSVFAWLGSYLSWITSNTGIAG